MGSANTKDCILDTAEQLFAENGFAGTSLRDITGEAGVNLASVNYHFGSREALILAVFERRLVPMNDERLRRLQCLEEQGDTPLPSLVRAFIGPALEMSRDPGGARFIRLLGRSYTEPRGAVHDKVRGLYEEVVMRFRPAFARALPQLPAEELYWRLHFLLGVLAYCMAGSDIMQLIASSSPPKPDDTDVLIQRLTAFLVGGMEAPLA